MIDWLELFLTLSAVGVVLISSEIFWRNNKLQEEAARKTVHIVVGSIVAFTPFFMTIESLRLLAAILLIGVILSRQINAFRAIHEQREKGFGEIFFALGIFATTLITQTDWIIALALLHMSLADGLAAVVGIKYGLQTGQYKLFGRNKTVLGTFTCFGVSTVLVMATVALVDGVTSGNLIALMIIPVLTTIIENLAPQGSDNLLISVVVASLLVLSL